MEPMGIPNIISLTSNLFDVLVKFVMIALSLVKKYAETLSSGLSWRFFRYKIKSMTLGT